MGHPVISGRSVYQLVHSSKLDVSVLAVYYDGEKGEWRGAGVRRHHEEGASRRRRSLILFAQKVGREVRAIFGKLLTREESATAFPRTSAFSIAHPTNHNRGMGRSKLKKRLKLEKPVEESGDTESTAIPIKNLPEKFICMHVKSGTKIRNVLGYALKEFPNYNSVVWTGAGQAIGKTISCVELFKRKHEGLHQVTKLRYTKRSKKSKGDETDETHQVPEIHILLTKNIKDTTELGYQAPGDCGNFLEEKDEVNSKASTKAEGANYVPRIDAEKFAAMGLRVRQKRPRDTRAEPSSRKNKKIKS